MASKLVVIIQCITSTILNSLARKCQSLIKGFGAITMEYEISLLKNVQKDLLLGCLKDKSDLTTYLYLTIITKREQRDHKRVVEKMKKEWLGNCGSSQPFYKGM